MNTEGAIAKYLATEAGNAAADAAIQAHGGLRLHPAVRRGEDPARRADHDDLRGHLRDHGDDHRPGPLAGAPQVPRPVLPRPGRRDRPRLHAANPAVGADVAALALDSPGGRARVLPRRPAHPQPARALPHRRAGRDRRDGRRVRPVRRTRPWPSAASRVPTRLPERRSPQVRAVALEAARRPRSTAPVGRRRAVDRGRPVPLGLPASADAIRAAQAALLADMDRVADAVYGRIAHEPGLLARPGCRADVHRAPSHQPCRHTEGLSHERSHHSHPIAVVGMSAIMPNAPSGRTRSGATYRRPRTPSPTCRPTAGTRTCTTTRTTALPTRRTAASADGCASSTGTRRLAAAGTADGRRPDGRRPAWSISAARAALLGRRLAGLDGRPRPRRRHHRQRARRREALPDDACGSTSRRCCATSGSRAVVRRPRRPTSASAIIEECAPRLPRRHLPEITEDTMPGELANVIAGRVANLFNFRGPNFTTDAACASGLAAIIVGRAAASPTTSSTPSSPAASTATWASTRS